MPAGCILVDPILLMQWYVKLHPDSGPHRVSSISELEAQTGVKNSLAVCGRRQRKARDGMVSLA